MQICQGVHRLRPPLEPGGGASGRSTLCRSGRRRDTRGPVETQQSGYETICFVEIRVAGKCSAVSMTTPTTTSAIDEHEGGEAIASNYRRQQRRPTARAGQANTTSTRHRSTPTSHTQSKIQSYPNQRAISTCQGSHTSRATPANRAPSAARQDTESKRGRPTGDYTAQHSAPPARHVEG